jgi:hypothetical protein
LLLKPGESLAELEIVDFEILAECGPVERCVLVFQGVYDPLFQGDWLGLRRLDHDQVERVIVQFKEDRLDSPGRALLDGHQDTVLMRL